MKTCRARGASSLEATSTFHGAAAPRTPTPFSPPPQDQTHFFSTLLASSSRPSPPRKFLFIVITEKDPLRKLEQGRVSVARRIRRKFPFGIRSGVTGGGGGGAMENRERSERRHGLAFICTLEFSLPSGERMSRNNTLEARFC